MGKLYTIDLPFRYIYAKGKLTKDVLFSERKFEIFELDLSKIKKLFHIWCYICAPDDFKYDKPSTLYKR